MKLTRTFSYLVSIYLLLFIFHISTFQVWLGSTMNNYSYQMAEEEETESKFGTENMQEFTVVPYLYMEKYFRESSYSSSTPCQAIGSLIKGHSRLFIPPPELFV